MIFQQITSSETLPKVTFKLLHPSQQVVSADRVQVAERSAMERGESQSEHCSDVSFHWVRQYSLLQAEHCLIRESRQQTHLLLLIREPVMRVMRMMIR